ncbi:MAG: hypothetical protein DMG83_07475 [Acidobacteria bacterium]|nr:MAG: hypothetical protein DMG83_07475 [Acidobacteriota bacterium]
MRTEPLIRTCDANRLFGAFREHSEESWIHGGIQALSDQFRLRHSIPALVIDKHFYGCVRGQLELSLSLFQRDSRDVRPGFGDVPLFAPLKSLPVSRGKPYIVEAQAGLRGSLSSQN